MRIFMSALAIIGAMGASAVAAQDNKVVVELYTSQGCSSCPPADELLAEMVGRDDVIALAFHVDYWDYLGWKDSFGSPGFTARQHGYAQAVNATTVYTPQMIIGGVDHVIGSKAMEVMDYVAAHRAEVDLVTMQASRSGDNIQIQAQPKATGLGNLVVQVVRYNPEETVAIRRGENAGKSINYVNIVKSVQVIGRWDGVNPLNVSTAAPGNDATVIIIQRDKFGPILASAEVR